MLIQHMLSGIHITYNIGVVCTSRTSPSMQMLPQAEQDVVRELHVYVHRQTLHAALEERSIRALPEGVCSL